MNNLSQGKTYEKNVQCQYCQYLKIKQICLCLCFAKKEKKPFTKLGLINSTQNAKNRCPYRQTKTQQAK